MVLQVEIARIEHDMLETCRILHACNEFIL